MLVKQSCAPLNERCSAGWGSCPASRSQRADHTLLRPLHVECCGLCASQKPLKSHLAAPYSGASPIRLDFLPPPLLCPYPLPPPTPSLSLPPLYPPPPPLLLLFFSSMLDTSVWHVFPIRPVLRYRETGNHLQPQTHPDAGNWAETVAAQPWRQPQDTVQRRQPPQASFHQTLPTLPEWAGTCAGREMGWTCLRSLRSDLPAAGVWQLVHENPRKQTLQSESPADMEISP